MNCVSGVDEAGRGAWAGNVVVAAVTLPAHYQLPGLDDSKRLTASKREALFTEILRQAVCVRYAQANARIIDRINIHQATLQAMAQAAMALTPAPDEVLVDGKFVPDMPLSARAVVGGDGYIDAIAAASIVAKVIRDRQLLALDGCYPNYGFSRHKGYGTAQHHQALLQYGVLSIHRRSFAPIRRLCGC